MDSPFTLPRIVAVVLIAVLSTTGATWSVAQGPSSEGRVAVAVFDDVSPVYSGQQVKVRGVKVGTVGTMEVDERRNVARVPLHLDPKALPVHTDATARVTAVSFLGERYIKLNTGSPSAPVLGQNQPIPTSQTSRAVDLQTVLNGLNDPTASALASMVVSLGRGMNGNGPNIQQAMRVLRPAMRNTDELVTVLAEQNELLGNVVDRVEPVTSALAARDGQRLDRLVGSAQQLLAATRSRDQELEASVGEAPSTLRAARRTLQDLTGTSRAASSTLAEARPTINQLPQISQELDAFSRAARPALDSANPLLDRADSLLEQGRPVAQQLRTAGPDLESTVRDARPIVAGFDADLGNVLQFFRNWALTTNGRDGISHYFRAYVETSAREVTAYFPGLRNVIGDPAQTRKDPSPNQRLTDGEPTADTDTDSVGPRQGDEGPANALPTLGGGGLLDAPSANDDGGATGLTRQQEQGALGFLLGGR